MSELVVGILGLICIVAIVVTLFQSKTLPSIAFIVFPFILAVILVLGGYIDLGGVESMIKTGFSSTAPTAALFVFSVLYFGIMTDAGMFDVIIGKLMKLVGNSVIGVTVMTTVIALIGHLDGGGASTFCIVVPSMLPVYKKMHMRPTTLLRVSVLAMGVLNLMPWSGPTARAATVLGIEAICGAPCSRSRRLASSCVWPMRYLRAGRSRSAALDLAVNWPSWKAMWSWTKPPRPLKMSWHVPSCSLSISS